MTRQTIFNIRRCLHATFGEKEVELSYGIQIPFGGMTGTGGRQIENQTNEQLQRTKQKNNLNLCWALSRKHAGETLRASYTHTHTHTCARVHTLEIISQLITYWCVCVYMREREWRPTDCAFSKATRDTWRALCSHNIHKNTIMCTRAQSLIPTRECVCLCMFFVSIVQYTIILANGFLGVLGNGAGTGLLVARCLVAYWLNTPHLNLTASGISFRMHKNTTTTKQDSGREI